MILKAAAAASRRSPYARYYSTSLKSTTERESEREGSTEIERAGKKKKKKATFVAPEREQQPQLPDRYHSCRPSSPSEQNKG